MTKTGSRKRFGQIAISKGYIEPQHLIDALAIQIESEVNGGRRLLTGEILVEMNLLTQKQVEEIMEEIERSIQQDEAEFHRRK